MTSVKRRRNNSRLFSKTETLVPWWVRQKRSPHSFNSCKFTARRCVSWNLLPAENLSSIKVNFPKIYCVNFFLSFGPQKINIYFLGSTQGTHRELKDKLSYRLLSSYVQCICFIMLYLIFQGSSRNSFRVSCPNNISLIIKRTFYQF